MKKYIALLFTLLFNYILGLKFGTNVVHGSNNIDEKTGNLITPITLGTTFYQLAPGIKPGISDLNSYEQGYFYSRIGNPTRGELERTLALLENGKHAAVFGSGMAAISTIIQLLKSGDHVIAMNDLYGGTINYFNNIAETNKIDFTYVDFDNMDFLENLQTNTKLIWLESLTNPLLKTTDIKIISNIAKKYNCLLVVDSTFSSPYLFNPLEFGADIVLHSATKYINGHSDVIMGAIICNNDNLIKKIRFIQSSIGAIPSPFDCYLTLRGLKTLHLRIESSQKNAIILAKYLESHRYVKKVFYPGLETYKYYNLVKKQFRGTGTIISFYFNGDSEQINKFLKSLKIFKLAVSLGAVESLICLPALMTHLQVSKKIKETIGITDNLIRISVGIEDSDDLVNDFEQAFNNI